MMLTQYTEYLPTTREGRPALYDVLRGRTYMVHRIEARFSPRSKWDGLLLREAYKVARCDDAVFAYSFTGAMR
jgi:hypothetical protein